MTLEMEKWNQKTKELAQAPEEPQSTSHSSHRVNTTVVAQAAPVVSSSSCTVSLSQTAATLVETTKTVKATTSPNQASVPTQNSNSEANKPSGKEINLNQELELTVGNICLLCKRQFNSTDMLRKHQQLSELHKYNLELARQKQLQFLKEPKNEDPQNKEPKSKHKNKKRKEENTEDVHPPEATELLDSNNVGSKLLKKMGWREGEGLGKHSTGITTPVEVEIRTERAGLGLNEKARKEDAVLPGDSYQIAAKKKARARFFSLLEEEGSPKKPRI